MCDRWCVLRKVYADGATTTPRQVRGKTPSMAEPKVREGRKQQTSVRVRESLNTAPSEESIAADRRASLAGRRVNKRQLVETP